MTAYGDKGCACWPDEDSAGRWMPNARCRFHGLLADYTPPRTETGTYRVDLSTPPDGPECPPGVHSMFDPCPGGCLNDDEEECTGCGVRQDYLGPCEECEAKEDGRPQCDVCGSYAHSFEDHDDAALLARDDLQESLAQFRRGEILPVRPRPPWWQRALVRAALWLWRDR